MFLDILNEVKRVMEGTFTMQYSFRRVNAGRMTGKKMDWNAVLLWMNG